MAVREKKGGPAVRISTSWYVRWALMTVVVLTGCPSPSYYREFRDCDGFEFSLATGWGMPSNGSVMRFSSASGNTMNFLVNKILSSGPKVQSGFGQREEVPCFRSAAYWATSGDGLVTHYQDFIQIQLREGQPIDQQELELQIAAYPSAAAGISPEAAAYPDFKVRLDQLSDRRNNGPNPDGGTVTNAYYPSRSIAGRSYTDVLESSVPVGDAELARQPLTAAAWRRVVIARGVGLVQFELRDGTVFDRQP